MSRADYWSDHAASVKQDLRDCGCTDEEIRKMSYEDSREILERDMPDSNYLFIGDHTRKRIWSVLVTEMIGKKDAGNIRGHE